MMTGWNCLTVVRINDNQTTDVSWSGCRCVGRSGHYCYKFNVLKRA